MFNSLRLKIARERRGLTKKKLAELTGVTTRTLSTYENKGLLDSTDFNVVHQIADALNYPIDFFYLDNPERILKEGASFRAMTKLSASKRDAALSAGTLAIEFDAWLGGRFKLREPNLIDCRLSDPETAAEMLREHWGLGKLSISNMVHLLEYQGVKVFSLSENCVEVDAFSFWLDKKPFVLLNTMKTPERSRFDSAHELGHLVLHKHASNNGREAEEQADKFAAAFLMPRGSILASVPRYPSLEQLIKLKSNWKVSLSALIRRTYDLQLSSEWHYRQLNVELSRLYGRKSEPCGIEQREGSLLFNKAFDKLRQDNISRDDILRELKMPLDEIASLTFNHVFFMLKSIKSKYKKTSSNSPRPNLKRVI